jgi:hypothetical protein
MYNFGSKSIILLRKLSRMIQHIFRGTGEAGGGAKEFHNLKLFFSLLCLRLGRDSCFCSFLLPLSSISYQKAAGNDVL